MEKYINPEIDIIKFSAVDVIATSNPLIPDPVAPEVPDTSVDPTDDSPGVFT